MRAALRLQNEQEFHDAQAAARARVLGDLELQFSDDAYLDHESWIRPGLALLGNVANRPVLDLGCGHGMASVVLARRGARVTAVDLSRGYLTEARRRALANRIHIDLVQANGEELPFAEGSFTRIWGNAILHHLDMEKAAREIRRVLTPDGIAVFCEPWAGNPVLGWARRYLPYRGKARTPDELPLRPRDVAVLRDVFPSVKVLGQQLISMVKRFTGNTLRSSALLRIDEALLRRFPGLQTLCRYVIIELSPGDLG